jgi:hypothetical protein
MIWEFLLEIFSILEQFAAPEINQSETGYSMQFNPINQVEGYLSSEGLLL